MYYTMFQVRGFRTQPSGICVMRTSNLANPASWRAWDGTDGTPPWPPGAVCKPVESMMHGGLSWNSYYGKYLLIGINQTGAGTYEIAFKTSSDLINWSAPTKLYDTKGLGHERGAPHVPDPARPARRRNYETTGRYPYLYFTRFNGDTWGTMDRDLVRVPLRLP
jgi:hypothetical protein